MLIEFRVQNHRSIAAEQVITLEFPESTDSDDAKPVSTVAALYGANASGKTNFLSAMQFMAEAVSTSHRVWSPDEGVPRDAFAWGSRRSEPTLLEVAIAIDGVRYEYGFVADDAVIREEWLYAWPHRRKQVWFEREGSTFTFGEHLRGENKLSERVTRPNSLFLSAAVQNSHEQLLPVYRWFRRLKIRNIHRSFGRRRGFGQPPYEASLRRWLGASKQQLSLFDSDAAPPESDIIGQREVERRQLLELLSAADVGIVDIRLQSEANDDSTFPRGNRVLLQHASSSPSESWIALEEESAGTRQLLRLAPFVLDVLTTRDSVLVVDELESSLHPLLALHLVRLFNDPTRNPLRSQLIFSTHDTHLLGTTMGEPALSRSQVWLSEKDGEGATQIYPMTDFKPRKDENLERGYLQGRYGAIPFLGELAAAKE